MSIRWHKITVGFVVLLSLTTHVVHADIVTVFDFGQIFGPGGVMAWRQGTQLATTDLHNAFLGLFGPQSVTFGTKMINGYHLDGYNNTLLHRAIMFGGNTIPVELGGVRYVLKNLPRFLVEVIGVNINAINNQGKTALDLAREKGQKDIMFYLSSKPPLPVRAKKEPVVITVQVK